MGASPAAGAAVWCRNDARAVAAAAGAGDCYQSAKHEVPAERTDQSTRQRGVRQKILTISPVRRAPPTPHDAPTTGGQAMAEWLRAD